MTTAKNILAESELVADFPMESVKLTGGPWCGDVRQVRKDCIRLSLISPGSISENWPRWGPKNWQPAHRTHLYVRRPTRKAEFIHAQVIA